jgi:hypothetical protein
MQPAPSEHPQRDRREQLQRYFPYQPGRAKYLIDCSERFRFIYVANPKAACSTMRKFLQYVELDGNMDKLPTQVHDKQTSPLLSPDQMKSSVPQLFSGDEFFRFSIVRNPYTRALSAYRDKIVSNSWERQRLLPTLGLPADSPPISFLEFLRRVKARPDFQRDIHWATQKFLLQPRRVCYHFIGRFENFNVALQAIAQRIGGPCETNLEAFRIDHHATGALAKLREHLGAAERDLIIDIFEDDFYTFRYSFDPAFAAA